MYRVYMEQIVQKMVELASRHEPFALATVIVRNGSAPRSAGAKMLMAQNGEITGTVGGGILEAQVRDLAARVFKKRNATIRSFQFNGKDAASMDAICGGQVEVLIEWVDPGNPDTAAIIQGLAHAVTIHQKAWLITILPGGISATTHSLVQGDGTIIGILPAGLSIETVLEKRMPDRIKLDQALVVVEPVNISGTALIFGAGHVSRSLAEFTRVVGFWTVVVDDRPEYASRERFPWADQIVVLDSFSNLTDKVQVDQDCFLVIVTRGHLNDQSVLEQMLKTRVGYIGMIGSRRKCEIIFEDMRKKGFTDEDIRRVHAPIGIPIHAETPEEIGVSIVAEMIRERALLQKDFPPVGKSS
jgi:xanthine dehydrogenase accessory factor